MPDKTAVKTHYEEQGSLCKCNVHREAPGPDHSKDCPWFANTKCEKIRLIPHVGTADGKNIDNPLMQFKLVPWEEEK